MAYSVTSQIINGATGKVGELFVSGTLQFSDIFDGVPLFYPGSLIQVQEVAIINTTIVDSQLVDRSSRWFEPVERLGTYQILGNLFANAARRDGNQGYLTNQRFEVSRIGWYTITANPNVLIAQHEQISLDGCNFYLVPEVYSFPGNPIPQPGSKLYPLNPALLGSTTISRAPLANAVYRQQIEGLGLYLYPGVEGINIEYKVAVINNIYTDYPAAPVPSCLFLEPDCNAQYNAFLANPANDAYATLAECQAVPGAPCTLSQWVCPTNPLDVRDYYYHANN